MRSKCSFLTVAWYLAIHYLQATTSLASAPEHENQGNLRGQQARSVEDKPWEHRSLSQCGTSCTANSQCNTNPCLSCNGFVCYNPYKCAQPCSIDKDCSFSIDGCTACGSSGKCVNPVQSACVMDEGTLRNHLSTPSIKNIVICQGTTIPISRQGAMSSATNGLTIECQGGTCTLDRTSGSGRILYIAAGNVRLTGLTFRNGYVSTGAGGAVFITGSGNQVENCVFENNECPNGKGGAVSMGNGEVTGCSGFGNIGRTCDAIFLTDVNQCVNLDGNRDNSQCSDFCSTNKDCSSRFGTCTICWSGRCIEPSGSNQCFNFCYRDSDCSNVSGPCTRCLNQQCVDPRVGPGSYGCVSTESDLRSQLQTAGSGTVTICQGSTIQVTQEISTSANSITLTCQGGSTNCVLRKNGSGRILYFSGNNILLSGITFTGGNVAGQNGGAVYLGGTGHSIIDCVFTGNSAQGGKGGALYINAGDITNTNGSGNSAAQCSDAYYGSTGACVFFTN